MKTRVTLASIALCQAGLAQAALPDLKTTIASVDYEYLSYSGDFGSRRVINAQSRWSAGKTKAELRVSHGVRKADGEHFTASRVYGTVVRDWNSSISTRTSASIAERSPLFVNRELIQEVSWKAQPGTVLTVGGRYANYFGGVHAWSWSAGAAQYFNGGMVSYRFTSSDIETLGHSVGHVASVRLNDRGGSTQLWAGRGTAIHDADWLGTPERGRATSVELRRSQRLGKGIGVNLGVKRSWYDTPSASFHGTGVHMGLTYGG